MSKARKTFVLLVSALLVGAGILLASDSTAPEQPVRFSDASNLLDHRTWSSFTDSMLSAGVCVLDANGDGWQDIFIPGPGFTSVEEGYMPNPQLGNRLFLNRGLDEAGLPVFQDVSEQSGLLNLGKIGVGCAAADYDNDGTTDLVVANATKGVLFSAYGFLASPTRGERVFPPPFFHTDGTDGKYEFPEEGGVTLFRNLGNDEDGVPRFTDLTLESGLTRGGNGASVAWADVDRDGWLDLFVANYLDFDFAEFSTTHFAGHENVLWRNNGDGTFTDVTEVAGLGGEPEFVYTKEGEKQYGWREDLVDSKGRTVGDPAGNTLAAAFLDFNEDSLPDLITMDDIPGRARLYENQGALRFREVSREHGFGAAGAWMGIAVGDLTGNGRQDVFATNLGGPRGSRYERPDTGKTYAFNILNLPNYATYYNWLWLFDGERFRETASATQVDWGAWEPDIRWFAPEQKTAPGTLPPEPEGLERGEFGFGTVIFDYDNDGALDLLWIGSLRKAGVMPQEARWQGTHGRLLKNEGDGTSFRDTTLETGVLNLTDPSDRATFQNGRGVAVGDFTNNGSYDVVFTNAGGWDDLTAPPLAGEDIAQWREMGFAREYRPGPTFLYLSEGGENNWLKLKLEGTSSNRSAVGARILIEYREHGKKRKQVREIRAGESFASQNSLEPIFGLGKANSVGRLTVFWPSGIVQTQENIAANQRLVIQEP